METKSPFSQGAYSGATTPISCRVFPGEHVQRSFGVGCGRGYRPGNSGMPEIELTVI
jgi:hypothetical protein